MLRSRVMVIFTVLLTLMATCRGKEPSWNITARSQSTGRVLMPHLQPGNDFESTIEFKDVCFNYPTRPDIQVFHGLSLRVDAGETLAIVGTSGCGKTTLIELMQRFYDTNAGEVLIGGENIKELNLQWLRSRIGVVNQEPVLFNTTITENIRIGKEDATQKEVEDAAKSANAHDFITSFPDGYNSVVGEDGELLSGGQKQRIAIARALVRDPVILLLDEATSALDSQSEKIVQNALEAASIGRTTILIAHRLSTIQNSTKIASIKDGVVAEFGTHSDLMSNRGVYYDLVTDQMYANQLPHPKSTHYKRDSAIHRSKSFSFTGRVGHSSIKRKLSTRSLRQKSNRKSSSKSKTCETQCEHCERNGVSIIGLDEISTNSDSGTNVSTLQQDIRESTYQRPVRPAPSTEDQDDYTDLPDVTFLQLLRLNTCGMLWTIELGTLAALIVGTVNPAFAIIFGEVIKVFSRPPSGVLRGTHVWGATFLGLSVLAATMIVIKNVCFSSTGERVSARLRTLLFKAYLRQNVGWFDEERNTTSTLTHKLSYDAGLVHGAIGIRIGTLVESATGLILALAVAFAYSWILALVIVGFLPVIVVASAIHFSIVAGSSRIKTEALKESSEVALEGIRHMHTIAIAMFGLEMKYYNNFRKSLKRP